jgi:hypothetical protein
MKKQPSLEPKASIKPEDWQDTILALLPKNMQNDVLLEMETTGDSFAVCLDRMSLWYKDKIKKSTRERIYNIMGLTQIDEEAF